MMTKNVYSPYNMSKHKINSVAQKENKWTWQQQQQLAKTKQIWWKRLIEKKSAKTDMKEITESIKAHIDMYKLTLHNVGYNKQFGKQI